MSLYIEPSNNCCALSEICELRDHSNASSAMETFCLAVSHRTYNRLTKKYDALKVDAGNFYFFAGVVGLDSDECTCAYDDEDDTCAYCVDQDDIGSTAYVQEFADLIRAAKLGQLFESYDLPNKLNSPNHIVRVCLWQPDHDALQAWATAHCTPPQDLDLPPITV